MAQKSFLSGSQWEQAREVLSPPLMTPDGDVRQVFCFSAESFSSWLGAQLEEQCKSYPEWDACQPVILGSWGRGELCPKSDVDVLFCGDEESVRLFTDRMHERGLKLRYRMPQNLEDWTENVEAFDILALLKARPCTPEAARKLHEQQKKIWTRKNHFRRTLLKAVRDERRARALRYDSITNYLEPNIKYGPGGLRDLEQGLQIYELFAEKFTHPGHALNVLQYYRNYFLSIRQKLHLEGHGDILSGAIQFEIGRWLGFRGNKEFMRSLQRGLSRVHFYSDWIVAVAQASAAELKKIEQLEIKKIEDLSSLLHKNSNELAQKKVRENLDVVLPENKLAALAKKRGAVLDKVLDVKASDDFLVSVFRSRLIDKLVPEIRRLVGYVQHDQYHRFTADSHIMQACREVKRIYKKPAHLGPLKFLHAKITAADWKILAWSALYHDLAKGLESGESHSDLGTRIVERDFAAYGMKKEFTREVQWLVQNHLELSQAAFRKNAKDPKIWQDLHQKNITGKRLHRLALFTVMDIRATNPEAWNEWKAKLLKDLILNLESRKAQDYFKFQTLRLQKQLQLPAEIVEDLGPVLLESLSVQELVQDLKEAESCDQSLLPRVYRTKKGDVWIRFHDKQDRQGLLSAYVTQLYSLGLSIRHASIQTIPNVGVYDWFQVSTTRSLTQLSKLLENSSVQAKALPTVHFDSIQLVSQDDKEWVISFKAKDQSGLLASAAKALSDHKVSIKSAQVHTWGRQVDDVFFVKPSREGPQELVASLNEYYGLSGLK
ncbi:MAG: HD domain-containing protein [Bdellovibrio sp.]